MGNKYITRSQTHAHTIEKAQQKSKKKTANKKEIKATHERWTDTVGQLS